MKTTEAKLNPLHELFVTEMIAHGNRRIAYQKVYPDASNYSARTCAARLIAIPEVAEAIRKGLLEAKQAALQTVKDQYEGKISDIEEKRAVLAQIIRGEAISEKEIVKNDEKQTIKTKGDAKDRIKAIILDNLMEEQWNNIIDIPDNGAKYVE